MPKRLYCTHPRCAKRASYGKRGHKPVHCAKHAAAGEVNVVSKRCAAPGVQQAAQLRPARRRWRLRPRRRRRQQQQRCRAVIRRRGVRRRQQLVVVGCGGPGGWRRARVGAGAGLPPLPGGAVGAVPRRVGPAPVGGGGAGGGGARHGGRAGARWRQWPRRVVAGGGHEAPRPGRALGVAAGGLGVTELGGRAARRCWRRWRRAAGADGWAVRRKLDTLKMDTGGKMDSGTARQR